MSDQAAAGITPSFTPDTTVSVRDAFGIDQELSVPAFSQRTDYVPEIDSDYRFDRDTTLAILAGFARSRTNLWRACTFGPSSEHAYIYQSTTCM